MIATIERQSGLLQWGHALMAWKTRPRPRRSPDAVAASMGPRFNGVEDRHPPFSRRVRQPALQWGHALMAWKTDAEAVSGRRVGHGLQWGHALMAWKTHGVRRRPRFESPMASMGPRFNGVEDHWDTSSIKT